MRRLCAWCRVDLDGDPSAPHGGPITHGICRPCARRFTGREAVPLQDFLDTISAPTVLVDHAGGIVAANRAAREALPAGTYAEGRMPGDVLRCVNAPLPAGCGRSHACSACELRGSIDGTFETGRAMDRAAAYLEVEGAAGPEPALFRISTERVDGLVLLRLDAMERLRPA